jgi:hypothetical protein
MSASASTSASNKRARPSAPSDPVESSAAERVLLEHDDPVFQHFELYEKNSGNNYTGSCVYCKFQTKGLKAYRARAHLGKIRGKGIDICTKVPDDVYEQYKAPAPVPALKATQADADRLFGKSHQKDSTDAAVAEFFYDNAIAFNVADSDSFKNMCRKLTEAGVGYKAPHRKALSTTLLDDCVKKVAEEPCISDDSSEDES